MSSEIVIGISGASGVIYGIRLLEVLKSKDDMVVHLVISEPGKQVIGIETEYSVTDVEATIPDMTGVPVSMFLFIAVILVFLMLYIFLFSIC